MSVRTITAAIAIFAICLLLIARATVGSDLPAATPVEHVNQRGPGGPGDTLGTISYAASQQEQPFFNRLAADEVATASLADDYDISTKDKVYVGWFGVVRLITEDKTANRTLLTVEHKYFDGLTDSHIQAVSFNGGGDFQAALAGTGHRIPPLSLIKVYGTVTKAQDGALPRIDAEFVRCWHWGAFTFLAAYGTQRGSDQWRKANQVALDEIYEPWPHPCHHYYEQRLGKRPDGPEIRQRLLDAAGPVSGEASQAMERLADLLAVGHPWSPAETMRQSEEHSQIHELVKTTGTQQAAIRLLLQALQENDERVSWSGSEKFHAFDPAGEAIETLVKLLDAPDLRVRARAVCALSSGYGAKAEPAVAALSRCVADSDPELRWSAIRALGDIGPGARPAVAALKGLLTDEDQGLRVLVAESLWHIDEQPDDVVPVFVFVLEHGDDSARGGAAERLKEMGPWAAAAVPALIRALKDAEWTNRCGAAEALGEIGPEAAQAITALADRVAHDEDATARFFAAEALGKLRDPAVIPVLITALANEDDSVRTIAVESLRPFGHAAKAAVPALMQTVKNGGTEGCFAAHTLGSVDAEGISAPALIELLGDKDPQMRRFAALGLAQFGRRAASAEQTLHDRLTDTDPGARIAAATAYWSVSGKADEAVSVLRSALQAATDGTTCTWAIDALAEIGPAAKAAVPDLIPCLDSDFHTAVTCAADALARIGPDALPAVPALTTMLERSEYDEVRACAARALWHINRSERALPVLQDVLRNSSQPWGLTKAARAVGEMGPQAAPCAPLLQPLLKHTESFVREAAQEALQQIKPH